uniref:XRE family transcriptional regulator n=1 Tax=Dulem virus 40 TaxID=3145758 RepID=A0AAU8AV57_9CAUD
MASASRRMRRANGMTGSEVRKALESGTPLNSRYALIPQSRRKQFAIFANCFGLDPVRLHEALEKERQ